MQARSPSKIKIGLILGRFQPFHKGHLYLIKKALECVDKIVIAVGSSDKSDGDNPLSYTVRAKMLKKVIVEEGLSDRVVKIVPLPDNPSNEAWLKQLLKNTGGFDTLFGNNAWPNEILEQAGYEVVTVPYMNRTRYRGVSIRRLLRKGGNWQSRVSAYLIDFIAKKMPFDTD